ncbi:hypothetical protein BT63DRAFT_438558 [Microthyrium microscopicum]|uniref:Zn(2)-C6 fungal-type domain-containing protein n=1 Tax=Microthyrium microscopicum TaxID=703497 RepID=A0A6A6UFP6_9PEZI|nr:hypothetical protein BT63DRAFT_438558 [Microthyrium microscopicum]
MSPSTPSESAEDYKASAEPTSPSVLQLAQASMQNVTSHSDLYDALEPALRQLPIGSVPPDHLIMVSSMPGHQTIAPAPPHPSAMNFGDALDSLNAGTVGPTSITNAASIAASSLAATRMDRHGGGKQRRQHRACDACSKRKVKCDQGRPCSNCADVDIPCTFVRMAKRRGPPNRVAEEHRRSQAMNPQTDIGSTSVGAISNDSASFNEFTAELIAPFNVVENFVKLYFAYVYPLYPFPHENVFMGHFNDRLDRHDQKFLALLAAMVGMAALSHERAALELLQLPAQSNQQISDFVHKCVKVATDIRGTEFSSVYAAHNIYDALTSFLLGVIGWRISVHSQFRLYTGESLAILEMGGFLIEKNEEEETDVMGDQMAKRLHMSLFVETQSLSCTNQDLSPYIMKVYAPTEQQLPVNIAIDGEQDDQLGQLLDNCKTLVHVYRDSIIEPYLLSAETDRNAAIQDRLLKLKTTQNDLQASHGNFDLDMPPNVLITDQAGKQNIQTEMQKTAIHLGILSCQANLVGQMNPNECATEMADLAQNAAAFLNTVTSNHLEPQWISFVAKFKAILPVMCRMSPANDDVNAVLQQLQQFNVGVET